MKKYFSKKKVDEKRDQEPIIHLKNACPLCDGEVKGNDLILFYCKKCNFLFNRTELKNNINKEN